MIRCIQISPHHSVQGVVIALNPFERTVTIKSCGKLWTGRPVPFVRGGDIAK
jgi:hypothetical protein